MVFLRIHDTARAQEGGRQAYTSNEFLEFAEQNHVFDGLIGAFSYNKELRGIAKGMSWKDGYRDHTERFWSGPY